MLSRHNSRQSSIACETASVASIKSFKSEHSISSSNGHHSAKFKTNGLGSRQGSQDSTSGTVSSIGSSNGTQANILNVAEMLLHGVADNEILDIWLRSIQCEEFVSHFIDAGYDMPTLSRITPQDLTAIGVTDPTKRTKILAEIKKLNLQDGIPKFKPASLSHWLSLIRLDKYYYKLLCDQDINTIDKLCQLTWEDFEELGITKLGHQKKILLAIERVKELDADSSNSIKPISEPIYDTNPSQILLVASAENHCMNGPVINKQSSTSELSSTGSGSMQSVYSAASNHYQPAYGTMTNVDQTNSAPANHLLPDLSRNQIYQQQPTLAQQHMQQSTLAQQHMQQPVLTSQHMQQPTLAQQQTSSLQQQQQPIYSQPMPSMIYQQPAQLMAHDTNLPQQSIHPHIQQLHHPVNQSHQVQQQFSMIRPNQQNIFPGSEARNSDVVSLGHGVSAAQNRQSMSQITSLGRLANLPLHQQQQLQQSSVYATLTRRPINRMKRIPPPVPMRTDSLKNTVNQDGFNKQPTQPPFFNQSNLTAVYGQSQIGDIRIASATNMGVPTSNIINGNYFNSLPSMTNNNTSFNVTIGEDIVFPPPPSPLPCITESCDITT